MTPTENGDHDTALEAKREAALDETLDEIDEYFTYSAHVVRQGYEAFSDPEDATLRFAAYGMVVQLGEAVKFLPRSYRDDHPEVRWNAIVSMRSRIAHQYNDVDYNLVWNTLKGFHPIDAEAHRARNRPSK